jgi:hypothetical protein
MKEKMNMRTRIVINDRISEQVNNFNYSGYRISVTNSRDFTFYQM